MRRVLITGASGNLGCKLRSHLEARPGFELVLLDKVPANDPAIVAADLSVFSASWAECFRDIDVVVHLAADSSASASWPSLVRNNIDATLNVFEAARVHGVKRVVFASSLRVMLGYEKGPAARISPELDTNPSEFYGVSKVVGERLARHYAETHGLSVICLRIGWVKPGENSVPPPTRALVLQRRWLSNRDFCGFLEHAIAVDDVRFAVLHATSRVDGSMWDLSDTVRVLGYRPQDEFHPKPPPLDARVRRYLKSLRDRVSALVAANWH